MNEQSENILRRVFDTQAKLTACLSSANATMSQIIAQLGSNLIDDDTSTPSLFGIRVQGDERMWRTDKKNGLTAEVLCKRQSNFLWLFNLLFEEDSTVDADGGSATPRLSVKNVVEQTYLLYNSNEFVREICDKYALNQPQSLGYRAWISYLTARSAFMRMEGGIEYWYGLRAKKIDLTNQESQDGDMTEIDEARMRKDIREGRLMTMEDFLKQ